VERLRPSPNYGEESKTLPYPGGVKREKELDREAALAGWGSLLDVGGGLIASCRFCFFHHNSIKANPFLWL
jgi:hypothetical protein